MGSTLACVLAVESVLAQSPKFSGFDVTSQEEPSVTFHFSSADATSASPVIISAPGRKLTNADRAHRTYLQRHWLSLNVPKNLKLVSRTLDECDLKRDKEIPACDHYVFEDPTTGQMSDYYIYVGNWP